MRCAYVMPLRDLSLSTSCTTTAGMAARAASWSISRQASGPSPGTTGSTLRFDSCSPTAITAQTCSAVGAMFSARKTSYRSCSQAPRSRTVAGRAASIVTRACDGDGTGALCRPAGGIQPASSESTMLPASGQARRNPRTNASRDDCTESSSTSVGGRHSCALLLCRLRPPGQIVRELGESLLQCRPGLADWLTRLIECLCDGPDRQRARDDDHPHLAQRVVPRIARAHAGEPAGRIADDGRRPPEPFLEEVIGEILLSRLHAPVVFAGDEQEGIRAADPGSQLLQRRWRSTRRIFLEHAIEHRQTDCFGVDQLGLLTALVQLAKHEVRQPNALAVAPVGAIEDENSVPHDRGLRRG